MRLPTRLFTRPRKDDHATPQPVHTLEGGVREVRDLVAPDGFKVTDSLVQVGAGRYVRTFFVAQIPAVVFVGWLDELYALGDVDISIHLYPGQDRDVVNELTSKITQMQTQMYLDEKRGDLRDVSLLQRTTEDAWALREQIQTNQNRMFYVSILLSVAGDTLEELDQRSKLVEERLGGRAIHVRQAFLRQAEALKSVVPTAQNHLMDVYRNLDLGAATALFPFGGADLAHEGGVLLGANLITGGPVFYNSFAGPPTLANQHLGIFATAGAGKSFLVKLLSARSSVYGVRTVFIDPEGEYAALVKKVGGVYVRLTPEGSTNLNPFDIEEEEDDRGVKTVNALDKVADLKGLVATMVEGAQSKLTPEEAAVVEETLREEYRERGITSDPASLYERYSSVESGSYATGLRKKPMPTFSSFYDRLVRRDGTGRLATLLKPYLKGGSLGIFDGESQTDLKDQTLVAFDVSKLEEKFARPLAMHVVLSWVWEKFVKKNPGVRKRVVVDEAWMFMKYRDTADFLENMARRARKRSTSLCVATQHFAEFADSPQGRAVLNNMETVILMRQNPAEVDAVQEAFKLPDGQRAFLLSAGVGDALIRAGRHVAVFRVMASPYEAEFLQTGVTAQSI